MSNKNVKKGKLQKIKRPGRIGFLGYVGDLQGCGHIRVIYPYLLLNHLRDIPKIEFYTQYMSNYISDPNFYRDFTIVQFQRSATSQHLNIYKQFKSQIQKKFKVPLVYEIDDMLIDIPEWNYANLYYKENEENVKQMLGMADGVITSTRKLKEVYGKYNNNIEVIPNHLPKFVWGDIFKATDYYEEGNKIKILWAGSQNHFALKDMVKRGFHGGDFGSNLINFIRKTTDIYEWNLMGAIPTELESIKHKIKFTPWKNIFQYPSTIKAIEPDICIAPLEQGLFNECKSDIKHLEYVACGATGVFSDIEPYKNCTMKAKTDEEMVSMIEKLANDIDLRSRVFDKDHNNIRERIWWEEGGNLKKYVDTYLRMFNKTL